MAELDRLITENRETREFHRQQYRSGIRGASIEVLACNIREKALLDAKTAIERMQH